MPRATSPPRSATPNPALERRRRLQSLRTKLEAERQSWSRWLGRLKRAFHTAMKVHSRIGRLEREIGKLESP